ncbi:MAG: VanZ family protein [Phycisphaerae bacterium]
MDLDRSQKHPPSRRRILRWVCGVVWVSFFILTHVPVTGVLRSLPITPRDVVLHAIGYGALGAVFSATLVAHGLRGRRLALVVVPVLLAYGAFDELTQELVGRDADWQDWLADALGAVIAAVVAAAVTRRKRSPGGPKRQAAD